MFAYKRKGRLLSILLISLIIIINIFPGRVSAEVTNKSVVILLDNSGSMNNHETRIGELAKVASSMVLDSIKEDEVNISIITFGEKVTVLKGLNEEKTLEDLKKELNNVALNEQSTNLKDGMEKALEELSSVTNDKSIIVLSDGKEDPIDGLTNEHKEQLSNLINKAVKDNVKINTIALSDDVDSDFLSSVASTTGGLFREGKTADKLFQSLVTIMGSESDFVTLEDYTTDTKEDKEKEIILSSSVEEVIINIAACDNKKPEINVKLNNETIEPLKTGDMYYVYRFDINSKDASKLNITSLGDGVSKVIVQFKSKAKINIVSDINKYISLPKNVPIDLQLLLECDDSNVIEGSFIASSDGKIITSTIDGIFNYHFSSKEVGENIIRYTAIDKNNGVIAVAEVTININNYPSFYYENNEVDIVEGDKLTVKISLNENVEISELSGELVLIQGENEKKIPLTVEGKKLVGEIDINEAKDIKYYANIRGKNLIDGTTFAYPLPIKSVKVYDKPIINLAYIESEDNKVIEGKNKNIRLNILEGSIISEDTLIKIYDSQKNELGSFKIAKGQKGEINVNIKPIKESNNLELFFVTDNGVEVNDKITTNLNIYSKFNFILKETGRIFLFIILPIAIFIGIIVAIYLILMKRYKEKIEGYKYVLNIAYSISPDYMEKSISGELNNKVNNLYINLINDNLILEEYGDNDIGHLVLINKYKEKPKPIQGLYTFMKDKEIFKVEYTSMADMYSEYEDEVQQTKFIYGKNRKVTYKINKKIIQIYI